MIFPKDAVLLLFTNGGFMLPVELLCLELCLGALFFALSNGIGAFHLQSESELFACN